MVIPPVNSVEYLRGPQRHYALAVHAIANANIMVGILLEVLAIRGVAQGLAIEA